MRYALALVLLVSCHQAIAQNMQVADPFSGRFIGDNFVAEFQRGNNGYIGTLTLDGQSYPASATANGNTLTGKFTANGSEFSFTVMVDGDRIAFSSGNSTRMLSRAGRARGGNAPVGFEVVNETRFGRTLAAKKPVMPSVKAALSSALPEVSQSFDAPPQVLTAYEDTRDRNAGGATFIAMLQGKRVNGWMSCRLSQEGTMIAVVYCLADAPAGEAARLFAAPHGGGNAAPVQLREYRFPDGTGSIGLAEGWTTDAGSLMQAVTVKGPNQQEIVLGYSMSVVTPNSMAVQTQMQLIEQARQMGAPPPQLPPMLVAPFGDPIEVLNVLIPQITQLVWQNGRIRMEIDNLKELTKVTPSLPGGRAAVLTYGMALAKPGQPPMHYQVMDRVDCTPIGADSWMYVSYSGRAPDATFPQDLPIMLAIAGSMRENAAVIQQKTNENLDAMNQRFAAQQKAHQELVQAYDSYNRSWERNQNTQSRSADNFVEAIRGYRTVEDTTTGEKTQVDLGHVDQIVDRLNEADPGRYRQIPLRDEMDPIPGNR
jgi:hypothetical protein